MNRILPLIVLLVACSTKPALHVDLIIKNGRILDGNGAEEYKGSIAIQDGKIVAIGDVNGTADREIDAEGLAIAPGFIDMHAHLDPAMRIPDMTSHVMQGVTTALGGPDGGGPWPFDQYLDSLETFPLGMNVAYLVGHNRVRRAVMGMDNRAPTDEELALMTQHVRHAMEAGAFGISTGLKYLPGAFSDIEEVIALSKVAASAGGIYTSHLREEGLGLIAGVQEAITIGKEANIPIVLTHHKAIGMPAWGNSRKTLAMIDSARAAGIDVMADQYPYTASYTGISVLIPAWARGGGQDAFLQRLQNTSLKDSILSGIEFNILNDRGGGDLRRVQLALTPWDSTLSGKTLHDWAVRQGLEPNAQNGAQLVLEAQVSGGGTAIYHAMDDGDVDRIMQHPMTMIASDGRPVAMGDGWPHPRWYGTFPRVLGHYVRERRVLDLPTAIMKMTSMPADRLGLHDRGRLQEGNIADVVVFNPETIVDKSTFTDPHHYSIGIEYVLIDGQVVVEEGIMTDTRVGNVIRGPGYKN